MYRPPHSLRVCRGIRIPDAMKLERYRQAPAYGPRVLFFSGGTALRETSTAITDLTHNSIHLMTPFDSGGSSAKLRQAFGMPAVGDVRARLMAMADRSLIGNPAVYTLFAHRLPKEGKPEELRSALSSMAKGRHRLISAVADPIRKIIRNHLYHFLEIMPEEFDLRGASIGNLVLTSGYFSNRRQLDPVIYIFSRLVSVLGVVRPVINKDCHLAAELRDGRRVVGQHNMTGKEVPPLTSPIERIFLCRSLDDPSPIRPAIRKKVEARIAEADLICFPMGSFFTSLLAALLPKGVGSAVAANPCPKVYVPSTFPDPELLGYGLPEQVEMLRKTLCADAQGLSPGDVLDMVVVDPRVHSVEEVDALRRDPQITVIEQPLVSNRSRPRVDPELFLSIILSLS